MKIVFWNFQGGRDDTERLLGLFESWGADFVLIAEVPGGFSKSHTRGPSQFHALPWTVHVTSPGQPMAILIRHGCELLSCDADPRPSKQASRWADVRPLVRLRLKRGNEVLSVVTCHAPYQDGGAAPYTYTIDVMKLLNEDAHQVDLWMGDINTYSNTVPGGQRAPVEKWKLLLSSPTSKRATGSPLDKIIARATFPDCVVGRIIPTGGATAPAPGTPHANDQMEPTWGSPADIPSDHAPIYLNTNHGLPPADGMMDVDDDDDEEDAGPPRSQAHWFKQHGL